MLFSSNPSMYLACLIVLAISDGFHHFLHVQVMFPWNVVHIFPHVPIISIPKDPRLSLWNYIETLWNTMQKKRCLLLQVSMKKATIFLFVFSIKRLQKTWRCSHRFNQLPSEGLHEIAHVPMNFGMFPAFLTRFVDLLGELPKKHLINYSYNSIFHLKTSFAPGIWWLSHGQIEVDF